MRAGILHRDLSLSNIMYRFIWEENEAGVIEKVCGVLTDFDLASWTDDLKKDHTKTSQQRTRTPPFMAHDLLDGSDALHLYRHDLESLFYVMLILATHYEIQHPTEEGEGGLRMRQGLEELPYENKCGSINHHTGVSLPISALSFQTGGVSICPQTLRAFAIGWGAFAWLSGEACA